eukprot:g1794.t1
MRAFLIHFGGGAAIYDKTGLLCRQIGGYAQGGVLDAPMFQIGAKYRVEKTNEVAYASRAVAQRKEAQAMASTYLDDAGVAAKDIGDWCEWFAQYRPYLS